MEKDKNFKKLYWFKGRELEYSIKQPDFIHVLPPCPLKSMPLKIFIRRLAFFGFLVVKEPYTGQSTIETWVIPTKWGVHHISTTNGYRDIEFWHFWRPRATPVHNTPGQTVDFFRNKPKMGFNLILYVPLPKKVVQNLIWPYHWISEHPGYTLT